MPCLTGASNSTRNSKVSPGTTFCLNLTSLIARKYVDHFSGSSSVLRINRPPHCAIASICNTPGITGSCGKCPWKKGSFDVMFFIPTIDVGPSSITLSTSCMGYLCGRSSLILFTSIIGVVLGSYIGACISCFLISLRINLANLLLMVCPGRVATMRPLMGLPIRAMSPMISSSLCRVHSLSHTSGLCCIYPSFVESILATPSLSHKESTCSWGISRSYITMALSMSPPLIRFAWRRGIMSRTKTKVLAAEISFG